MREIKFRAWDEKNKKMVYRTDEPVEENDSLLNYLFTQFEDDTFGFIPEGEGDRLPTMQFTGLHDKQGKEIWEGDIVQIYDKKYMGKANVVFAHGVYRVYFDRWFVISVDVGGGQLEVIGNIYEKETL